MWQWHWQVSLFSHWISLLLNVGFFFTKCNSRILLNDTQFFLSFQVREVCGRTFSKERRFSGAAGIFFLTENYSPEKKKYLNRAEHISFFEVVWSNLSSFWWLQMMTLLEKKSFSKTHILTAADVKQNPYSMFNLQITIPLLWIWCRQICNKRDFHPLIPLFSNLIL